MNKRKLSPDSNPVSNPGSSIRFESIIHKNINTDSQENHDINILTDWSPKRIQEFLFGKNLEGPIRKYLEPIGAKQQCVRAKINSDSNTICWLCGCKIGNEKKACEHIIPVLHAIMLKGIITTGKITSRLHEANANMVFLSETTESNYLWAHMNCNSAKSGTVFIKFNDVNYRFEPDEYKCNQLASQIIKLDGRKDCYLKETRGQQNIYDTIKYEMKKQCEPINQEFKAIGSFLGISDFENIPEDKRQNLINTFIRYTIDVIKLYASQEALEKILTPEETLKREKINSEEVKKAAIKLREQIEQMEESIRKYYLSCIGFINLQDNQFQIPIFEIVRLKFSNFFYWNPYKNRFKANNKIIPETTSICEELSTRLEEAMGEISKKANINSPVKYELINIIIFEYLYQVGKELGFSMVDTTNEGKDSVILYGNTPETTTNARTEEQKIKDIQNAEALHQKLLCSYLFVFLMKVKKYMYKEMLWSDFIQQYPTLLNDIFFDCLKKIGIFVNFDNVLVNFERCYEYINTETKKRINDMIATEDNNDSSHINKKTRYESWKKGGKTQKRRHSKKSNTKRKRYNNRNKNPTTHKRRFKRNQGFPNFQKLYNSTTMRKKIISK